MTTEPRATYIRLLPELPKVPGYAEGDRVYLISGPEHGSYHHLTEAEAAQGYRVRMPDPSAEPAVSSTPIFDLALGTPTADGCAGTYAPYNGTGTYWHWKPARAAHYALRP